MLISRSKYGNPIYFLLPLGKMCVFCARIFQIEGKKRDLFIYCSVYIVCNFANKNKELPSIMQCLPLSWFSVSAIPVFFSTH